MFISKCVLDQAPMCYDSSTKVEYSEIVSVYTSKIIATKNLPWII